MNWVELSQFSQIILTPTNSDEAAKNQAANLGRSSHWRYVTPPTGRCVRKEANTSSSFQKNQI